MKIAIIGSGISGISCAYYLRNACDVTLFESNDYLGGHTATKTIETDSGKYAIDTGFIVYNDRTYPRFIALLDELGIKGQATEMSFSIRNDNNKLEYNGHSIGTLFAQKRNFLNPRFYHLISDIVRFNNRAKANIDNEHGLQTLGDFLSHHQFGSYFANNYILPMGSAIWSTSINEMLNFPLPFFLKFFLNHGLLEINNRPQWYVVPKGSNSYIKAIESNIIDSIRLSTTVTKVQRLADGVLIDSHHANGQSSTVHFDQVIFACHSDQALSLLADPSHAENELLSALRYQPNEVILHTDDSVLPKSKRAWAAWNFRMARSDRQDALPKVTYNMNILQGLQSPETFCVTLNDNSSINPEKVLGRYQYDHPQYSRQAVAAQQRRHEINGLNHSWFCGAYWYNGFHEDGLRSSQDVASSLKDLIDRRSVNYENVQ
jgi:predicted NAD/FAD-binding protein